MRIYNDSDLEMAMQMNAIKQESVKKMERNTTVCSKTRAKA